MQELTRGRIIQEGLDRAGRPDLFTNGRLWLNEFLEDQYNDQDWKWLIKDLTLAVVQGGAFPVDFRTAKIASIGESARNQQRIRFVDADEYQEKFSRAQGETLGNPEVVWEDTTTRTFQYWPTPATNLFMTLKYYSCPALPDPDDSTTDNEIPFWGGTSKILIQSIYIKALEYNDDARFEKEEVKLGKLVNAHKMNQHNLRAGRHRLKLGKDFRPKRGRY
jgi:hypothetical protein